MKICLIGSNRRDNVVTGGEVVVGPSPTMRGSQHVPSEMRVERQKLRPGSGVLSVKVIADGPTRVLKIVDVRDAVSS